MAEFSACKVVASLPGTPAADTLYLVRVGLGFRPYVTNHTGTVVAYGLDPIVWSELASVPANLTAIAGLTSAADKGVQFTGSGTAATFDLTAAGKALLDDADAAAQRATLGLVIGTNVQAQDAELAAIAGLTSAANKVPYFTGSGNAALADLTAAGRALIDDASANTQRETLGVNADLAQRDLIYAGGYTGLVDLLNAFADGFNNTAGIDSGNSSNYSTAEAGVVKPTVNVPTWISSGTPSAGIGSGGAGTAANFNDNSTGTTYSRLIGNITGQTVANRIFAKVDLGSLMTISKIVLSQVRLTAGSTAGDGLYYSTDNVNWTQLGSNFGTNTTPTDITQTGVVTARYIAHVLSNTNYSTTAVIADLLAYDNASGTNSIDLRGVSRGINDTPSTVDVFAIVEETDALTLNTDFFLHGSRDGNNSYVQGTAVKLGTLANGLSLIAAIGINVSGQSLAKNLRPKATSANGKNLKLHGWVIYGRS